MKISSSSWNPDQKLVVTHLRGEVNNEDVDLWEKSLQDALEQIENNDVFKILVNLFGFNAIDIDVHKRFREIIPSTLATYGFRTGYIGLFENVSLILTDKRGIRCLAAAHVHQDATKMEEYQRRFGKQDEGFFADPVKADDWIRRFPF